MESRDSALQFRYALPSDVPDLTKLIEASVRTLQAADYTAEQMNGALGYVFGVDNDLIADGTYFIAETRQPDGGIALAGCGGWSRRCTLFGMDGGPDREPALLDPETDAARIRAIFVHPSFARRGIGTKILEVCETAAASSGFRRLQMASTLTGVPFYGRKGYLEVLRKEIPLRNGLSLPVVVMEKRI